MLKSKLYHPISANEEKIIPTKRQTIFSGDWWGFVWDTTATEDTTKASDMISFNMNDDASTRQHTSPIILHNSTPILNSNTGPMESDLQD
ncbi:hypothetical protein QYF36_002544 [Acer negundo]|nr:hypothetical protein QYF36_002544 [Acer negundo]